MDSNIVAQSDTQAAAPASERLIWLPEGMLSAPPPTRHYLLNDRNGKGLIPMSKVGFLVGAGGASKTMTILDLALAVATGSSWLGAYPVAEPGHVALFLGEEDMPELQRRLHAIACLMDLSDDEKRQAEQRIMVAPLAGVSGRLVDGEHSGDPSELAKLWRDRLAAQPEQWRLIVFDPLARFGGKDTEVSQGAATTFVNILEKFTTLQGKPTVLCAHHTSQAARASGVAMTATASRGVTALTDGARFVLGLMPLEDGTVELRVTKNNYAPAFPSVEPLILARRNEFDGALDLATPEERAAVAQKAKAKAAQKADVVETNLLAEARKHPTRYTSMSKLVEAVAGNKQRKLEVARAMVERGVLVFTPTGCTTHDESLDWGSVADEPAHAA